MRVYSESEIQELLRRAAALQAARRDPSRGLTLEEIRRAAEEAGIDARYVDAAAQGIAAQPAAERTDGFWGGTYRVADEMLLDHEVDDDEWAVIVAEIRRSMGQRGRAEALGRGYDWRYEVSGQEYAHVTLTPRSGRTHVDVSRVNQAAFWYLAPGMAAFFAGVMGLIAFAKPDESLLPVALAFAVLTVVTFFGSRALFAHHTRSATRKNAELLDRIAALAGESEASPRRTADAERAPGASRPAPLLDEIDEPPPDAPSGPDRTRTR